MFLEIKVCKVKTQPLDLLRRCQNWNQERFNGKKTNTLQLKLLNNLGLTLFHTPTLASARNDSTRVHSN